MTLMTRQSFGNSFVPLGGGGLESRSAIAVEERETDECRDEVRGDGGTFPLKLPLLGCDVSREVAACESSPLRC